eukprot:CAMPEP_0171068644 /NCGR_PEP_ID=MMETSP0766_2-20121228/8691_1 /TAXON_ID=439317 /ORGANISM="Gambierdiscus australes, Strain CAWD 149" /LENGTH=94 /DNA_ID=CAMNT_0011524985 /DNA_START=280 /DNA_END=562 /DNA_ORIENTATION=-
MRKHAQLCIQAHPIARPATTPARQAAHTTSSWLPRHAQPHGQRQAFPSWNPDSKFNTAHNCMHACKSKRQPACPNAGQGMSNLRPDTCPPTAQK